MEPGRSRTERPTTRRETATRQFLIMSDHALLHSHHYLVSSFPPLPPPMGWRRKLGVRTGASSGVAGNGLYVCYEIPGIPRVPGLVDFLFPLSRKKRTLLCGHDLICPNSYPRRRSISLVLCNPLPPFKVVSPGEQVRTHSHEDLLPKSRALPLAALRLIQNCGWSFRPPCSASFSTPDRANARQNPTIFVHHRPSYPCSESVASDSHVWGERGEGSTLFLSPPP